MSIHSPAIGSTTAFLLAFGLPLLAQVNTGELRLRVKDPAGLGIKTSITVSSEVNQYSSAYATSDSGEADFKTLPYGVYLIRAERPGFTPTMETVEVRSELPTVDTIKLAIAPVNDRFPYVTISRASDDAGIHTNNRETLGQRLATDTIKTAAVTFDEKGFGTANELSVASYFDSTILDN